MESGFQLQVGWLQGSGTQETQPSSLPEGTFYFSWKIITDTDFFFFFTINVVITFPEIIRLKHEIKYICM